MKNFILTLVFILSSAQTVYGRDLKKMMLNDLEAVRNVYETMYAPKEWKLKHAAWQLDAEIEKARAKVEAFDKPTVSQYQRILKTFIASMQDYHVSVNFVASEKASLPLNFMESQGRYFIAYIDRSKLPGDTFPFQVGDELVTFAGKPASEEVDSLISEMGPNTVETNRAIAALLLTSRRAARAMDVPKLPVVLGLKSKGSSLVKNHQLGWTYVPEMINLDRFSEMKPSLEPKKSFMEKHSPIMLTDPEGLFDGTNVEDNTTQIGARKSYIPELGQILYQTPKDHLFHGYIYKNAAGKLIGFVRISAYSFEDGTSLSTRAEAFKALMKEFNEKTDALVIDQINNPGGSVFYLYALASALSDQSLATPKHRMTITQSEVAEALPLIETLKAVQTDTDAKGVFGETAQGYPVSYSFVQTASSFLRFLVSEWAQGKTLTSPYHIWGVDRINPAPNPYTKPILLLTNSLDFSGGDFFPAILQDNKRVTILGTRTAGAGGYVLEVAYPNLLGVGGFRVTGSLAERVDLNPIENLGVKPDIEYTLTPEDLQNSFSGYASAINKAVSDLIK